MTGMTGMTATTMTATMGTMTTVTTEAMTEPAERRPGLSVRVRITAAVAALVTLGLVATGLIAYVLELQRVEDSVQREVEQELDEFARLRNEGVDPLTGRPFGVESLLYTFLQRNVPDDDELLVGWVDDRPRFEFPRDPLVNDPEFRSAAQRVARDGGTTRLETAKGEVRITGQPVSQGSTRGALLVVAYLDEDRDELNATMQTYAIVAVLSLLVITGAAWWQAGRLLSPLRALRRTAEEIGGTDLSRRVPETGNDDITALTRTVNGMLDRLEAAFVGQRQFLDDAGHELKTPLTILRGHLELVDLTDPDEVAETRELLLDEVDRMSRLVEDLILLAKSNRPDFLTLDDVDAGELVRTVLAKARALGDRRWVLDEAPDDAVLLLDEQRLTQALLQLAHNAVKHTDPGDEIGLGASEERGELRCWVRDTGPGVRPADRDRIFERFGRADVRPGDEGFGLGLSIVAAIARAHGGTAHVEDPSTGRGARFVVAVPAVRRDHAPGDAPIQEVTWPAS
ncbi:ATP-binding protein [Nocardioides sp. TF02-7]|uniref:sensor histidine kinase n=1 Tax=Nocardioides sp. TF02-7 TaxID=2917724 RepID=UPI001F0625DD|nr:ATP-binding protein [Nocardioides sp. TF02-7]UMG92808.1 HAMP domain-containing histidine kinase [Nocardioides sp. TF02-7]